MSDTEKVVAGLNFIIRKYGFMMAGETRDIARAITLLKKQEATESKVDGSVDNRRWCECGQHIFNGDNFCRNCGRAVKPQEREAVEPEIRENGLSAYYSDRFRDVYCGECGASLRGFIIQDKYCPRCGRMVKWR